MQLFEYVCKYNFLCWIIVLLRYSNIRSEYISITFNGSRNNNPIFLLTRQQRLDGGLQVGRISSTKKLYLCCFLVV